MVVYITNCCCYVIQDVIFGWSSGIEVVALYGYMQRRRCVVSEVFNMFYRDPLMSANVVLIIHII